METLATPTENQELHYRILALRFRWDHHNDLQGLSVNFTVPAEISWPFGSLGNRYELEATPSLQLTDVNHVNLPVSSCLRPNNYTK